MTESKWNWCQLLADETELLRELASTAARTRAAALKTPDLTDLVETQIALCEQLESFRTRRDQLLARLGYPARDFLVAVLDATPTAQRAEVAERFSAFVAAAEQAQREIQVNREFFSVALASLEDVIDAAMGETPTYGVEVRRDVDPAVLSFTT